MDEVELARVIAGIAHRGQTRWDGIEPYINHPERVAGILLDRDEGVETYIYVAAILHDVIEDSTFEYEDLINLGISTIAAAVVLIVSRRSDESYNEFIERIAECETQGAIDLKIADITDNLNSLPEGHGMAKRYEKALKRLA